MHCLTFYFYYLLIEFKFSFCLTHLLKAKTKYSVKSTRKTPPQNKQNLNNFSMNFYYIRIKMTLNSSQYYSLK